MGTVWSRIFAHVIALSGSYLFIFTRKLYVGADAGKSTIGGQILFLGGQVDDRTIQKYEKEAKEKSRESW